MTKPDPSAAVLADHITLSAPGTPGPNALIGMLLPRILCAAVLAVGHDENPSSAACAEQFAANAVHGGFATDQGFTWNRPTIHVYGPCTLVGLLAVTTAEGALAAMFTAAPDTGTHLRLFNPDGAPVTEKTGLGDLRARLATGRPALPVNSLCTGTIIDHRPEGTP